MKAPSLLPVLLALPVLALPLVQTSSSYAVGETCRGLPVTIVGHGEHTITGTAGDDVILTERARDVDGLAGDDTICVTGDAAGYTVYVDGGDDDDTIDTTAVSGEVFSTLGDGENTFVGGPGRDVVGADGSYDGEAHDVVGTGGGDDHVYSGEVGSPSLDQIDLGPGNDSVDLNGRSQGPGASLVGGTGTDTVTIGVEPDEDYAYPDSLSGADWVFRNSPTTGTGTANGTTVLRWDGFEQFVIGSRSRSVAFYGSDLDERVAGAVTVADLGGGDDVLAGGTQAPGGYPVHGRVVGGAGHDTIDFGVCYGTAGLDLSRHHYSCGKARSGSISGFESVRLLATRATVRGSNGPDTIALMACRGTVKGLGGADHLRVLDRTRDFLGGGDTCTRPDRPQPVTLDGGLGPDVLFGSSHPDVLIGGRGSDRAIGHAGRDRCVAEKRSGC